MPLALLNGDEESAAWTPMSLTGLYLWWADAGLATYGNGVAISPWAASYGPDGTQGTEALRPTCATAALNGYPVATFDSTYDDNLLFAQTASARYVAWLFKQDGYGDSKPGILGHATSFNYLRGPGGGLLYSHSETDPVANGTIRMNGVVVANPYGPWTGTTWTILTTQTASATSVGQFAQDRTIGGRSWYGQLAQLIIGTSVVSDEDSYRVEGYLAWRYGLTALLPAGHAYTAAPP